MIRKYMKVKTVTQRTKDRQEVVCDSCKGLAKEHPGFFEVTTHHERWGNDSIDTYETRHFCCKACMDMFLNEYWNHPDYTDQAHIEFMQSVDRASHSFDDVVEEIDEEDEEMPSVDVTSDVDTEEVRTEVPKTELEKLVDLIEERHPDWNIEKAWDGVLLKGKDGKVVCQVEKNWKDSLLEGYDYARENEVTGLMTAEESLRWMEEIDLKGQTEVMKERG